MAITKREAAIITAYTGVVLGEWVEAKKYIDEIMGRDLFTHELPVLVGEIHEKAKADFINLKVE